MSANQLALWYLVAAVSFILALKGLSSPPTARRGNLYGMIGMAIAVLVTLALVYSHSKQVLPILGGMAVGGVIGAIVARRVQMTQMPELVAAMHSLVGLAAVFIAIAAVNNPEAMGLHSPITGLHKAELFVGTFIGAVTFSGSVIAFGKLSGKIRSAPVVFPAQHWLNLAIGIAMIGFGVAFFMATESEWPPFIVMTALAFLLGFLLIIPIGGADMPVVISMLNSYSGWAAAGIGFSLDNPMLIIAGSLVGSSGAILSYIMCRAMNRSFFSVILGGFGGEVADAAAGAEKKPVKSGSPVRPGVRDGGHQQRVRASRRRADPRRQRRRQSAGRTEGQPDLRHAHHRGLQGQVGHRQQALDGLRLRRSRQSAVLHGQDDDGVRRREEGRRGSGQGRRLGQNSAGTAPSNRAHCAVDAPGRPL